MATRFYLPSTGTANVSPAFSTWTETTGNVRRNAVTTRISSAMTDKAQAHSSGDANATFLHVAYLSGSLAAQNLASGTVKGTMRARESGTNDNLNALRLALRFVSGDGTTFRTPVLYGPANGTVAEFNASVVKSKVFAAGASTNAVNISEGDRLFIEIGTTSTVGGTTLTSTISYGDDSVTDLPDSEGDANAYNPFVELSINLVFYTVGTLAATEADDTISATSKLPIAGALAATESDDTIAATSNLLIKGTSTLTEDDDTIVATGTISESVIIGTAAITEDDDAIAAAGVVPIAGTLASTEDDDTIVATGALPIAAVAAPTEDDDTVVATATLSLSGTADITESGDTLAATAENDSPIQPGPGPETPDSTAAGIIIRRKSVAHHRGMYVHLAFVPRSRVTVRRSQEAELLALAAAYFDTED